MGAALQTGVVLGGDRGCHFCHSQHLGLVTEKHYAWFAHSNLVFHRTAACDLWRDDFGYGLYEAISGNYAPGVQLTNLHTPIWWGGVLLLLGLFYVVKFRPGKANVSPARFHSRGSDDALRMAIILPESFG